MWKEVISVLELVFDQSLAGAMRQAKGHPAGVTVSQGVKLYVCEDEAGSGKPESRWEPCEIRTDWGAVLEGTAADVAPLSLALPIGNIAGMVGADISARKEVLARLEAPWTEHHEAAWERYWRQNLDTLARLRRAKETGEPIRIWATTWCPHEACGLYYACQLLRNANVSVYWVCPPREIVRKDGTLELVHGLGQFPPETLGDLAVSAAELHPDLRRMYADRWLELVEENAPLRVVVNGTLMSVPEDFFDFALRRNLSADGPKKMGLVIAQTLQQIPGIGDTWLYLRLMEMARKGEVQVVEPAGPDHPYSARIKGAGGRAANGGCDSFHCSEC